MSSLQDLLSQKEALEKKIADMQREERGSAISQVKALMSAHGLTLADISTGRAPAAPKVHGGTGSKVAVKFRNAATGDTWTGRGLQPKWLKSALASGRKLGDFAV